jgi:putative transposase
MGTGGALPEHPQLYDAFGAAAGSGAGRYPAPHRRASTVARGGLRFAGGLYEGLCAGLRAVAREWAKRKGRTVTTIRPELLDELLAGGISQEAIFGPSGVLKRLTGAIVERVLAAELEEHLRVEREAVEEGAPRNRRNGKSVKTLQSERGPLPIEVPRDRLGTFTPQLVKKHQTRLDGLDEKILAMYARGLGMREIQRHLEDLYGTELSPSLISSVTDAVLDELAAWQSRPLDRLYAVVWLDALVLKVREQGVVQNKAAYVAIGMNLEGRKEVLGLWLESTEGAKFWLRVLTELRNRGLEDVLFACCDGLKGFPEALEAAFPKTVVQTCIVHQVRYSLAFVNYRQRREVAADLRMIYTAESEAAAEKALADFERKWSTKYPTIAPSWRNNWARLTPFLAYPPEIRKMIYTTNAIESLNSMLRRTTRNKGHFPSDDAATKLLYLTLRNAEKKWRAAPKDWKRIYTQLIVYFGERLSK